MQAIVQTQYGTPDVLDLRDQPAPTVGPDDVLVAVKASPITQGDRRIRASDFPSFTWLPGRLMMGLFKPKNPVPGTMFAGRVVAVGDNVTRFAVGDDVFGSTTHGAHAELMAVAQDSAMAKMPTGLGYEQAAAVPYGAETALSFLRDLADVQPGERVLIIGALGGVGRFATQIAKALGAHVTAVCSDEASARALGADEVINHRTDNYWDSPLTWHVVFDTSSTASLAQARPVLSDSGRFISVDISLRMVWDVATNSLRSGPRALFTVAQGSPEMVGEIAEMLAEGRLRPVIDRSFSLGDAAEAHRHLETRPSGSVVLRIPGTPQVAH